MKTHVQKAPKIERLPLLLKLRRALLDENYEECGLYVKMAEDAGVPKEEIRRILRHPLDNNFEGE